MLRGIAIVGIIESLRGGVSVIRDRFNRSATKAKY